jgi:hypothetical protein
MDVFIRVSKGFTKHENVSTSDRHVLTKNRGDETNTVESIHQAKIASDIRQHERPKLSCIEIKSKIRAPSVSGVRKISPCDVTLLGWVPGPEDEFLRYRLQAALYK